MDDSGECCRHLVKHLDRERNLPIEPFMLDGNTRVHTHCWMATGRNRVDEHLVSVEDDVQLVE